MFMKQIPSLKELKFSRSLLEDVINKIVLVTTAHAKRYVALSTDGKLSIQLSVGKFKDLENLTHYEPFKDSKINHNVLSNALTWSLSISNELNGEIFVALSRPGNLDNFKRPRKPHPFIGVQAGSFVLKGKSPEVNKTEALDALEKGISNPATWIFSILNKVHNIDFKLNILECYDLEGSNNGELVKSFKVDSNKQYFKESSRCSYESVKNSVSWLIL
ncbi:hypothetical protein RhiirA4_459367 [Rhizophagus irregularis]|uniref:Uncharacterized protein n=1 Tax=Rhizophagus irregularis TaxID=588596 RepID=A0A2I1GE75_9GLOM|nr:hypothetical protein RhiirA4_459367 [Rhizophagus irregularis]